MERSDSWEELAESQLKKTNNFNVSSSLSHVCDCVFGAGQRQGNSWRMGVQEENLQDPLLIWIEEDREEVVEDNSQGLPHGPRNVGRGPGLG